jgi:chromosome segregation ATPase
LWQKKGLYDDASAAADALVAEGSSPTLDNVLKRLGTGSKGTIQKHMLIWWNKRPQVAAVATEVPTDIVKRIAEEINRAKHEGRAEIGERLSLCQNEASDLATTCENLESEVDRLMEELDSVSKFRDRLLVQLQERATEVDQLTRENERERYGAEQARIEVARIYIKIESQTEKLNEQSATIEKLTAELLAATTEKISSEKEAAVLASRLAAEQVARIEAVKVASAYETQCITLAECISAKQELASLYESERDARIIVEKQAAVLAARMEELIRYSRLHHQTQTPDANPDKEILALQRFEWVMV